MRGHGQIVIVVGAHNYENAIKFVQFAAHRWPEFRIGFPYDPLRHSAWELVDKHIDTNIDMKPHMPTALENSKNFITINAESWAERRDDLFERFSAWLSR